MIKDKNGKQKLLYLKDAGHTKIRRHIKIRSDANTFDPLYKEYFEQREQKRDWLEIISNYECYAGLRVIQPC